MVTSNMASPWATKSKKYLQISVCYQLKQPRTAVMLGYWLKYILERILPLKENVLFRKDVYRISGSCFPRKNIGNPPAAASLLHFFKMRASSSSASTPPQYCREWWLSQIRQILRDSKLIIQSRRRTMSFEIESKSWFHFLLCQHNASVAIMQVVNMSSVAIHLKSNTYNSYHIIYIIYITKQYIY